MWTSVRAFVRARVRAQPSATAGDVHTGAYARTHARARVWTAPASCHGRPQRLRSTPASVRPRHARAGTPRPAARVRIPRAAAATEPLRAAPRQGGATGAAARRPSCRSYAPATGGAVGAACGPDDGVCAVWARCMSCAVLSRCCVVCACMCERVCVSCAVGSGAEYVQRGEQRQHFRGDRTPAHAHIPRNPLVHAQPPQLLCAERCAYRN